MPKSKQEIEDIVIEMTNNILKTNPEAIIGKCHGEESADRLAAFMRTLLNHLNQKSDL